MFFSTRNYAAMLFIGLSITSSTTMRAVEPETDTTKQALNPISTEITLLKENDPDIKKRYEIKSSYIKSLLNWIDKVYLIESRNSWESKASYYFFLNIFPGSITESAQEGGLILLNEQQAPLLHRTVQKLCDKLALPKPAIFLSADKELFNAAASSLCSDLSMIIIGEKLLHSFSETELESILAHELAHIKKNHVPKNIALLATSMALPFIIWYFLTPSKEKEPSKTLTFWQNCKKFLQSTPGKLLCIHGATVGCTITLLLLSRSWEEEADRTSIEITDNPEAFKAMIQKVENHVQEEFDTYAADYQFLRGKIEELRSKHPRYASYLDFFAIKDHQSQVNDLKSHKESESGSHPSLTKRKSFADEYANKKKIGAGTTNGETVTTA